MTKKTFKEKWSEAKDEIKKETNDFKKDFGKEVKQANKEFKEELSKHKEKEAVKKEKRRNPEGGMRVFWLCSFWLYIILSVVCAFSIFGIPLLIIFVPFSIWIWNNRLRGTKKNVVIEKHYIYKDKE